MKFDTYVPSERLAPYVSRLVITENAFENEYTVFPSTGLVIGFQYRGTLSLLQEKKETLLHPAGITGISDRYKRFKHAPGIGTILVYFTEIGFTQFATIPANELFNQSLSLETVFDPAAVSEVEEKLALATTDQQRIRVTEHFLLKQVKDLQTDRLIMEAIRLIYVSGGTIRIKELTDKLFISPSPFEKRFRKVVGTTPKKFASIVRLNAVVNSLEPSKSLTEICYENHFFDQAHFIRAFKQFTGETPERFKRLL